MGHVVVDHRGAPVERTTWRTLAVFAHTFSGSSRVVARAAAGRLTPEDVDRTVRRWCAHVFRLSRATLVVHGDEALDRGRPYVLLANHQSLLDIPAAATAFPGRLRFVAKQELRSVPMFGRAMEAAGIVFVDRTNRERAITQLEAARAHLAAGTSVFVAVEGTRSKDGSLGSFKKGGFHLARALGTPILPTWIDGTLQVIPPGQLASVTGQTVTVRFGAPIATAEPIDTLMARTREALLDLRSAGQAR
ncbi:MAG: lysophospholipid acyltransferase family protein [Myxococcota bacterium]